MSDLVAYALTQFYADIDIFLVLLVRVLAFVMILPILSGTSIPNIVKITFSVAVAFMLFATGTVLAVSYGNNIVGYLSLLVTEFFVGFCMAFVVYILFSIIYFAGQLIDFQVGFSMVSIYDPMTQMQVPITGNLLYFLLAVVLLQSGGLHTLLMALHHSLTAIPPGEAFIVGNDKLLMYVVGLLADFFVVGIQISMPIVGSLLIIDVGLGILVKAVPQMNVFVVGMPLKLLIGLVILYVIMPAFFTAFDTIYQMSFKAVENVIGGMSP